MSDVHFDRTGQCWDVEFDFYDIHPWSLTAKAPEKWWLEDVCLSSWVSVTFQGRTVKLREGIPRPLILPLQGSYKDFLSILVGPPSGRVYASMDTNGIGELGSFFSLPGAEKESGAQRWGMGMVWVQRLRGSQRCATYIISNMSSMYGGCLACKHMCISAQCGCLSPFVLIWHLYSSGLCIHPGWFANHLSYSEWPICRACHGHRSTMPVWHDVCQCSFRARPQAVGELCQDDSFGLFGKGWKEPR